MRPPERSFGFLLYDSARLLRRDFDRRARAIGLTRAQWSVLSHLVRYGGVNQAALADLMEIQPITLVRLLDRLEEAGWIVRQADPNDRRSRVHSSPTRRGRSSTACRRWRPRHASWR